MTIAAEQQQEPRKMQDLEQIIRVHAYHLWAADGNQEGNAEAYWLAAQREILASSLGAAVDAPSAFKKVAKKTKGTATPSRRKTRAA
jgi:hypothetical protein